MSLCIWCQGQEHSGGCDREALKEVIRVLRLEQQAQRKIPGKNVIFIQSLVSHRTQKPRIDIQVGEIHTQMSADAAMNVAKQIIQVAMGSYADAFIFNFLKEKVGLDDQRGVQIIQEFRAYREELEKEFEKEQEGDQAE